MTIACDASVKKSSISNFIGTLPREVIHLSPIVLIAFNNIVTLRDMSKEIFFLAP